MVGKNVDQEILVSGQFLADALGITSRQVRALSAENKFKKVEIDQYDCLQCVHYYVENLRSKQVGKDADLQRRKEIAETEGKEEAVLEKRLKRKERTRELVDGSEVLDAIEMFCGSVRRIAETAPLELKRSFPDIDNKYLRELDVILVKICNQKAIWPPK